MIRGMSYPQGIFYMDNEYIAHATIDLQGNITAQLFPFSLTGLLLFTKRIILSFPWYYMAALVGIIIWVTGRPDHPFYSLLLALYGYHFFFPHKLKQYHGAEHKIFSHEGTKSLAALGEIAEASIVNRNCSTNHVVTFYILFLLAFFPLGGNTAALVALIGSIIIPRYWRKLEDLVFFPISAFLQKHLTTTDPEPAQLKVGLLAYMTLVRREVVTEPQLLAEQKAEQERLQKQLLQQERERIIAETQWVEI